MAYPSREDFLASLVSVPGLADGYDIPSDEPGSGTGCASCREPFEDPVVTACNGVLNHKHYFCRACLISWLTDHNTCPSCFCVFFPADQPAEEEHGEEEDELANYRRHVQPDMFLLPPRRRQVALILNRSATNIQPGDVLPSSPRVLFITPPVASRNAFISAHLTNRLSNGLRFYVRPDRDPRVHGQMHQVWAYIRREFRDWLSRHLLQTMELWWMRQQLYSLVRRIPEHRFPSVGVAEWARFRADGRALVWMLGDHAEDMAEINAMVRVMDSVATEEDQREYDRYDDE
ncbi:unnamed protein product [Zymoseptoria tritici ST99CH_3D1]|nr:unnamed protein product [Zymoseptoria tritici ST99CH_3D1]